MTIASPAKPPLSPTPPPNLPNTSSTTNSLGLGSCINIPLVENGTVLGTINLLAEEQHFTAEKLAAYHALVAKHHAALSAEMAKG